MNNTSASTSETQAGQTPTVKVSHRSMTVKKEALETIEFSVIKSKSAALHQQKTVGTIGSDRFRFHFRFCSAWKDRLQLQNQAGMPSY